MEIKNCKKKNEKGRKEAEDRSRKNQSEFEKLDLQVGQNVKVKRPGSSKMFDVVITKVLESSVYGYRIKKDGNRYSGKFGQEDCFTIYSLLEAIKYSQIEKTFKYQTGDVVPLNAARYDLYIGVGEIVKCTSRTVHVDYGGGDKPMVYSLKSFSRAVYKRDEMQARLNGERNYGAIKLNIVTEEGKKRFIELGFDVSRVIVHDDPHKRNLIGD